MLLETIQCPDDIKALSSMEMIRLSVEIREFLINNLSQTGGHLASNLGVVELTLALHKVFNTPKDKIIWDVGHQSYVHKLLTGRREKFPTIRQFDGLSGFPKRCESPHDCFETGHSSTSISAAVGMAKARDLQEKDHSVIAVIGDGALTGGMAFEAMNYAGHTDLDVTVILNDNGMSISQNVGGLSTYLRRLRMAPAYTHIKGETKNILSSVPVVGKGLTQSIHKFKTGLKIMLANGMIFEGLGYNYYGPIDGHNFEELVEVLHMSKKVQGPKLIHVMTTKGKGYSPAEKNPDLFHGVGPFEIKTGNNLKKSGPSYSKVFGQTLVELARQDQRIVAITAAMPEGTGLGAFMKTFPQRFFDVGIAEQHGVTMAAGLAASGMKPVVAIYSTFLQRAYDQVIHDVCIQNLPVVFAIDRCGLVGNDGETHHGMFDLSYLNAVPNMTVLSPKDGPELVRMLTYALLEHKRPIAIRYPRGEAISLNNNEKIENSKDLSDVCRPEILVSGSDGLIVAVGKMVNTALETQKILKEYGVEYTVVNARQVSPINTQFFETCLEGVSFQHVFTLEDNNVSGGFGTAFLKWIHESKLDVPVSCFGIPSRFIPHGSVDILFETLGLNPAGVAQSILKKIQKKES